MNEDEFDPWEEWAKACKRANDVVMAADFESAADECIDNAKDLLALAYRLAGVQCKRCHGRGTRTYSSTALWTRGIGGQKITSATCDECWGTGRSDKKGVDLREYVELKSLEKQIESEKSPGSGWIYTGWDAE